MSKYAQLRGTMFDLLCNQIESPRVVEPSQRMEQLDVIAFKFEVHSATQLKSRCSHSRRLPFADG